MSWEDFDPNKTPEALARLEEERQKQEAYTKANEMSREDFIKKYGTTFVADDKGGNAASEVAGQDVGAYYDKYLAPGAKGDLSTTRGAGDNLETGVTDYAMPNWGAGKYSKDKPYFDGWDNVKPHPESQLGNGLEEFIKQAKPFAAMGAMALGAGAFGGWSSGAAASSAAAATPASGLAGIVGMNSGAAATALNAGALNAGVSLASGKSFEDSLKSGLTAAALSGVGGWASTGIKSATAGLGSGVSKALAAAGSGALTGAAGAAINGQDIGKGAMNGIVSSGISEASKYAGGVARDATGSADIGKAVSTVSNTLLRGGDIGTGVVNAAANYAGGQASQAVGGGFAGDVASTVAKAAGSRNPTNPRSLLSSFANSASKNNQTNLEDRFA